MTNRDSGELPSWTDINGCQLPKKIQYTPVRKKICDELKGGIKVVPSAFSQIREVLDRSESPKRQKPRLVDENVLLSPQIQQVLKMTNLAELRLN